MTVSAEVEAEIRRLYNGEHWPVGTIARQLLVHEDVVNRVIGLLVTRRSAPLRARLVDPYVGFIDETLKVYPTLCATRLHDMVKARGYVGSVRTLREHVATVRPHPRREAFLRTEPLIGEQSQIDWAHAGEIKVDGGMRAVWLFVIVLSWSRAMWAEFVIDLTAYSLARSLCRAAVFFGGTTRQWLFDNPKIVVLERSGNEARFHPLLVEVAGHFYVQTRLCAVRKANQKGKVERAIRWLRDRFLAGREVHRFSVEELNGQLLTFLDTVAHPRPHPTLAQRSVKSCLDEEKGRLLKLPERVFATDHVSPVAIDKTAFARFDTNAYSVPPEHVGKTLTLVTNDVTVRILDGGAQVAQHARSWGRKRIVEDPIHRARLVEQKRGAKEVKGRDKLLAFVPNAAALYERWVVAGRNVSSMTAQTLRLLSLYGDVLLIAAVDEVIARGTHDPGALAVLCEQKRHLGTAPVPLDVKLGDHVPERDVVPHNLETYDGKRRRD